MECAICFEPYTDPVLIPTCGHSFCRACLRKVRGATCPLCRKAFHHKDVIPNFAIVDRPKVAAHPPPYAPSATSAASAPPPPSAPSAPGADSALETSVQSLCEMGVSRPLARVVAHDARSVSRRIILLDNSGSTAAFDGKVLVAAGAAGHLKLRDTTRWEETKAVARSVAQLSYAAGTPCEIRLLNPIGPAVLCTLDPLHRPGTITPAELEGYLQAAGEPRGATPLVARLADIRTDLGPGSASGRVCLVVVTDGMPSGGHNPQRETVEQLQLLSSACYARLVVRLCTDNRGVIDFWDEVDKEVEMHIDVIDDFVAEAREVRKKGNDWLACSPILQTIREAGSSTQLLDLLDERRLRPAEVAALADLLVSGGDVDDLPDWEVERSEYLSVIRGKLSSEPLVFDANTRSLMPPINVHRLERALAHGASCVIS